MLWSTWQVDYTRPMTRASEGWKFIMTGVEMLSGLGNVYPTLTALTAMAGLN